MFEFASTSSPSPFRRRSAASTARLLSAALASAASASLAPSAFAATDDLFAGLSLGQGLFFNEFLANPPGADAPGLEFFELGVDPTAGFNFNTGGFNGLALLEILGDGASSGIVNSLVFLDNLGGNPTPPSPADPGLVLLRNDISFPLAPAPASGTLEALALNSDGSSFAPANGSSTFALVGGFDLFAASSFLGFDTDTDNDGTFDTLDSGGNAGNDFSIVFDAVSLLSSNDIENPFFSSPGPAALVERSFADDLGGETFNVGGSADAAFGGSDGPDGFIRLADGTGAIFDANGGGFDGDGLITPTEFDNTTVGDSLTVAIEEVGVNVADDPTTPGVEAFQLLGLVSDGDPATDGDQPGVFLTPGSPNDPALAGPANGPVFDVQPEPEQTLDPASLAALVDFENTDAPAGTVIAGTSFEGLATNERIVQEGVTELVEGVDLIADFNGNGIDGETVVLDTIDGDGTANEFFLIPFSDAGTRSEPLDDGGSAPLGPEGEASGIVVQLSNTPDNPDTPNFQGPDGAFDTADDILFLSADAVLNAETGDDLANQLGFTSAFIDTREDGNETGSSSTGGGDGGDFLGVTRLDVNLTADTLGDTFDDNRDGENIFVANDTDGTLLLTTDVVDLRNAEDVVFSFLLAANATGFEGDDSLDVTLLVEIDGIVSELTVLPTFGDDNDALDLIDNESFGLVTFSLADEVDSAQALFAFDTSSGAETIAIDRVLFTGTVVPEPSTALAMLGLGGMALLRRRRLA